MRHKNILIFIFPLLFACAVVAQGRPLQDVPDSARRIVVQTGRLDSAKVDSTAEDAPLDIGSNRGLFIVTPDRKLQLRILGSVRYLVVFDGYSLPDQQSLNPYEVPTGSKNQPTPSYHNSLDQSRLGFEATRRVKDDDIFIRLEMDFNQDKGFGIRHAYGKYGSILAGQTWSLFSQIAALPPTVDLNGPASAITLRTPQVRYTTRELIDGVKTSFSLEFPEHNFKPADSTGLQAFQLLPDPTIRLERSFSWGDAQVSAVLPILAGRYTHDGSYEVRLGIGLLAAVDVPVSEKGKVLLQGVIGTAITTFFAPFQDRGLDVVTGSDSGQVYAPLSIGGFATYMHSWTDWLTSTASFGVLSLESRSWVSPDQYQWGYNFIANTFWTVVEGARIGAEFAVAGRTDVSGAWGSAGRGTALFYYDF